MFARIILAALAMIYAAPLSAADRWQHAETGISIDRSSADLSLVQEKDGSDGAKADNILQFGDASEPATVYLYRSSFPNPALWLAMTKAAMVVNMRGLPSTLPNPTPFTIGGSSAPNGLRLVMPLPETARARATGVAIAQVGDWILKFRVTSTTRDQESVGKRLNTLISMVHFANPPPSPLPLTTPTACSIPGWDNGVALTDKPNDEEMAAAMFSAISGLADARGFSGLAKEPGNWCRDESLSIGGGIASLYRSNTQPGQWVMFVGDSGITITAQSFSQYAKVSKHPKQLRAKAGLFVNNWAGTRVVALFDNIPVADAALEPAFAVISGQRPAIFSISFGSGPENASGNPKTGK